MRTTSRGSLPLVFTVNLPSGPAWSDISTDIAAMEALDRFTEDTITIPYAKFPWFYNNVEPVDDDEYTIKCTTFPQWTIFARNQVQWSGAFVFTEVL